MGRKHRVKAENKRRTEDFSVILDSLGEEDELQKLLEMDVPSTYKCRPDYDHARPCGPVLDGPYSDEECACGCSADDVWCITQEEFFEKLAQNPNFDPELYRRENRAPRYRFVEEA